MESLYFVLAILYIGDVVFSISGTMAGCGKDFDIIGVLLVALATAIGGGTVRDLILGVPVFWVQNSFEFYLAMFPAILLFFIPLDRRIRSNILVWADALGLSAFVAFGSYKAYQVTGMFLPTTVLGVCTAVGGGVIRDLLCAREPFISKGEIYASAATMGALSFCLYVYFANNLIIAVYVAFLVCFLTRALGIVFHLSLGSRGQFIIRNKN